MFVHLTIALLALGATSANAFSVNNATFTGRRCGSSLSAAQVFEAEALFAQNRFEVRDTGGVSPIPDITINIYFHASTFFP
jgi:hypothetical protein